MFRLLQAGPPSEDCCCPSVLCSSGSNRFLLVWNGLSQLLAEIDRCSTVNCSGHGRCQPLQSSTCECFVGFTGPRCAEAVLVASPSTAVPAANCSWVNDTDYFPNELGNVGVNLTRQQCCDICHNHSKCTFAVHGTAAERIPRSCWLKAGDPKEDLYAYKKGATVCCPIGRVCPQAKPPYTGLKTEDDNAFYSVATTYFRVDIFGNCSAVATNLRTHAASKPKELLSSYNRVADNHLTDWSPCVGASLVAPGVVRVITANGYGHVDISVSTSCVPPGQSSTSCVPGWVTFEVRNISGWHADPIQKHLVFGSLCPADLCPTGEYPSAAAATSQGQTTDLTKTGNVRSVP